MKSITETLTERELIYSSFNKQSWISQQLKTTMHIQKAWSKLPSDRKEALDMIAHKIARILNGGVECSDNWHDIAGYATLVEQRLYEGMQEDDKQSEKK